MQTSDSFFERSLRSQGGTAQELRCYQEAKSLLGNERFGRLEPLQCQFRLAAIEVKHRVELQCYRQTERVGNLLGQCQGVIAERYTLLGVPEQPFGRRTRHAGADAGIVPAIELAMEAVPLGVIKPAPSLAMLARCRRLARVQQGPPGAVMSLQTQFV